uniref:Uncharacterized protein n=1 Tax=viral metagenome TaxID=1070528 RepID=A0A6C0DX80_9ZZZZ
MKLTRQLTFCEGRRTSVPSNRDEDNDIIHSLYVSTENAVLPMPVLRRNSNEGRPVDLNTLIAPIVAEPREEVPMEVQEEVPMEVQEEALAEPQEEALAEPQEEALAEPQEEALAEPQEVPMEIDDPPSHCLTGCMLCNAIGFYDCNDCLE